MRFPETMVFKWRLKAWLFGMVALLVFIRHGVMTPEEAQGCVLWALLFTAAWKIRKAQRQQHWQEQEQEGATPSTEQGRFRVSQMGPAWEQDAPYPELFDEQEDDL